MATARLVVMVVVLALIAGYLFWRHRRRSEAARIERETSARLAGLRDQLIQANKLATLGQVTAGVAHEINQPLAAISANAANARTFIDRGNPAEAHEAMTRVGELTDRIGAITRELRGFARRSSGDIEAVAVEDALSGTALLLRDRLRILDARLLVEGPSVSVRAERVGLEQVLVNLIQNSLDAGARTITIGIAQIADRVSITIADAGAGMSDAVRATLFMPFKTSKRDGLGLGLVISHDLIAGFGGTIRANKVAAGTEFVIELQNA